MPILSPSRRSRGGTPARSTLTLRKPSWHCWSHIQRHGTAPFNSSQCSQYDTLGHGNWPSGNSQRKCHAVSVATYTVSIFYLIMAGCLNTLSVGLLNLCKNAASRFTATQSRTSVLGMV